MQNHFWLIVCNKSAHKSGGRCMQQQQKQPFSIQHIAAHSICRSKYLNKFFWLPTKHYLNFLLLLLLLFFLKITLMHICYFSKIKLHRAAFFYMLCFVKLLFLLLWLVTCAKFLQKDLLLVFFLTLCSVRENEKGLEEEKLYVEYFFNAVSDTYEKSIFTWIIFANRAWLLLVFSSVFLFGKKLQFCLINCFYRSLQIELGVFVGCIDFFRLQQLQNLLMRSNPF